MSDTLAAPAILIANRGEIAVRVAKTAKRLGYRTVAIYSAADRDAPHVAACDDAYYAGEAPAAASYLDVERILTIARDAGVWAIHPGYGFLSERPEFAEACEREGVVFIGPSAAAMRALGDKARAKRMLEPLGIPFVPGYHGEDQSADAFIAAARDVGLPLLVKAAAGGGGRGMRLVPALEVLMPALAAARAEALLAFGDGTLLLERAISRPRHVEVQIAADEHGNVAHLGERECSVQRRFQKILEESPSTAVDERLRARLGETAVAIARAANYRGLGTIEFLLDERGAFYFIEANARLQVEHPVTEACYGLDLVELQIRIACGEPLGHVRASGRGHAIEVRLCAEDARAGDVPQTGTIDVWRAPENVRVDHALRDGLRVTEHYDSMLAKIVGFGETRDDARRALVAALDATALFGIETNAPALRAILTDDAFARGDTTTAFLTERAASLAHAMERGPSIEFAACAVAALTYRASATASGFFGGWASWSANARPVAVVTLQDSRDGKRFDVRVEPDERVATGALRATLGELAVSFAFEHVPALADLRSKARTFRMRAHMGSEASPQRHVVFAESGEARYFALEGRTYAFRDLANVPAASLAQAASGDGSLRAPTGGRVIAVRAVAGERLAPKSVAVVLEAMKIEHAVTVPTGGTVIEIAVTPGDRVDRGTLLLRLQPE